jgi:hypothetical protein
MTGFELGGMGGGEEERELPCLVFHFMVFCRFELALPLKNQLSQVKEILGGKFRRSTGLKPYKVHSGIAISLCKILHRLTSTKLGDFSKLTWTPQVKICMGLWLFVFRLITRSFYCLFLISRKLIEIGREANWK